MSYNQIDQHLIILEQYKDCIKRKSIISHCNDDYTFEFFVYYVRSIHRYDNFDELKHCIDQFTVRLINTLKENSDHSDEYCKLTLNKLDNIEQVWDLYKKVQKDIKHPLYILLINTIGETNFNLNFEHKEQLEKNYEQLLVGLEVKVNEILEMYSL